MILVTGGSSLPGYRTILKALEKDYETVAISKEKDIPIESDKLQKIKADLSLPDYTPKILEKTKPEIIIHMAAFGDVDGCEKNPKLAMETNYVLTRRLLQFSRKFKPFFIYLSTDYVFKGEEGNYRENDVPNPPNFYGLSKLAGELAVECLADEFAILRASSIYGFGPGRDNFAKFLVKTLSRGGEVRALVDQFTTPTQASLLGEAILEIAENRVCGIFHVVGERMSRFEFAMRVSETLNLNKTLIKPAKMEEMSWIAKRPKDSSLNCEKTREKIKIDFYSNSSTFGKLREEYMKEVVK
ncbi:MAG: SDR family oxidoreductase [Candidatus Micrarchaeota archaeon]|nr:SDR family oxidoreductase [Candidatus Micrarchaeota archaeon]